MTGEDGEAPVTAPLRIALTVYRGNPYCGGQGVYVRHLSAELVALGHSVTVFSGQPYPQLAPGIELVKVPSLDLYRQPDPFRRVRLREIDRVVDLLEVATMWSGGFPEPRTFSIRVRDAILSRRDEFDLVHDDQSLGSALLDLERAGLPVIASVHHPVTIDRGIDLAAAATRKRRWSLQRWYGSAAMQSRVARALSCVITVSEAAKSDITSEMGIAPLAIDVIPVGVDASIWRPNDAVARVPGRIMTTASSDVPMKGLAVLLEALAKLRTEREDAHLVVVGQLRRDSGMVSLIERLGLADAISFASGESDAELADRYASAELAVVPSLYEGFSLPAIEAMACGVPLVVSDGGALPEVVGDGALVVPAGDADALRGAIGGLLADREHARALGAAGRERATSHYTWRRAALSTEASYRRVLTARTC